MIKHKFSLIGGKFDGKEHNADALELFFPCYWVVPVHDEIKVKGEIYEVCETNLDFESKKPIYFYRHTNVTPSQAKELFEERKK